MLYEPKDLEINQFHTLCLFDDTCCMYVAVLRPRMAVLYSNVYNALNHSFDLSWSAENDVVFGWPSFPHQTTVTVVSSR